MNKTTHIWFLENKNNKWNTGKQCFFCRKKIFTNSTEEIYFHYTRVTFPNTKISNLYIFHYWPISFYKNFMKTILALYSEYISKWWKERPNDENLFALFSVMTLFETMVIKVSKFSFLSHWRLRKLKTTFRSKCLY